MSHLESNQAASYQWWRWPLMPVLAISGGALGSFFLGNVGSLSLRIGGFPYDGWMQTYVLLLCTKCFAGYLLVLISYYVAPRRKHAAAKTMTWLFFVFNIINITFVPLTSGSAAMSVLGSIAACLGSVAALLTISSDLLVVRNNR
jgi:hypothetical protein